VPPDVRSLLLELLRDHVCTDARLDGQDVVANGAARINGRMRVIALRITASAIATSLEHPAEPQAAAGALLTETQEELHSTVFESDRPATVIIS
jgi:hypothetical protein